MLELGPLALELRVAGREHLAVLLELARDVGDPRAMLGQLGLQPAPHRGLLLALALGGGQHALVLGAQRLELSVALGDDALVLVQVLRQRLARLLADAALALQLELHVLQRAGAGLQLLARLRQRVLVPPQVRLEGAGHLAQPLGLGQLGREPFAVAVEVELELRQGAPVALQVLLRLGLHLGQPLDLRARLAQGGLVPRQVGLEVPRDLPQPVPLRAPLVALAVEGHQLLGELLEAPQRPRGRDRALEEGLGVGQGRVGVGRDDQVAVDRLRVIGGVERGVVVAAEGPGQLPQGRVLEHVHGHAHEHQPAVQVGVSDAGHAAAELGQLGLDRRPIGQPVLAVLVEVAVLDPQLVPEEALERLLGLDHALRLVGAREHHPAPRDAPALADEGLAVPGRHVLERVEGRDHVEGAVLERQAPAVAEHQPVLVGGLHVDQRDLVAQQEPAQQRGAPAHVEHRERRLARPGPAQLTEQVGHQAVALVLVEGQRERVPARLSGARPPPGAPLGPGLGPGLAGPRRLRVGAAQARDSSSVDAPPGPMDLIFQTEGSSSMPCWNRCASSTSKVSTCSRWSIGVGAAFEWSYTKVVR